MLAEFAAQLEKSQREYDTVARTFTDLLSEIAETLEGEPRKAAFQAAHDALRDNDSASTQLDALYQVRNSMRKPNRL